MYTVFVLHATLLMQHMFYLSSVADGVNLQRSVHPRDYSAVTTLVVTVHQRLCLHVVDCQ